MKKRKKLKVMMVTEAIRLYLNLKPLKTYLKTKPVWVLSLVLIILLILSHVAGLNKQLDSNVIQELTEVGASIEK
jgi:hypothetical protein